MFLEHIPDSLYCDRLWDYCVDVFGSSNCIRGLSSPHQREYSPLICRSQFSMTTSWQIFFIRLIFLGYVGYLRFANTSLCCNIPGRKARRKERKDIVPLSSRD